MLERQRGTAALAPRLRRIALEQRDARDCGLLAPQQIAIGWALRSWFINSTLGDFIG